MPIEFFDVPEQVTDFWVRGRGFAVLCAGPPPPPPFRVLLITPINSNTLRAFFSREPRHRSAMGPADVLNRVNWSVSVLSGPGRVPVIEQVENVVPRPTQFADAPDAWSVDLRTDRRVLGNTTYLTVASLAITAHDGTALAPSPYDRDDHPGIIEKRGRMQQQASTRIGIDLEYDTFSGTYVLDPKQDVDVHAGLAVLKKRIIRRLLSSPGGFYHLPGYGVGLRVKAPFNTTQLDKLRRSIIRQVREEDGVASVDVRVARLEQGVLLISLQVKTVEGSPFGLVFEVPADGPITVV